MPVELNIYRRICDDEQRRRLLYATRDYGLSADLDLGTFVDEYAGGWTRRPVWKECKQKAEQAWPQFSAGIVTKARLRRNPPRWAR